MDITPNLLDGTNFINGYSKEGFRVNNKLITKSIILSPINIIQWENNTDIFTLSNYIQIISEIEKAEQASNIILLIGTGERYLPAPTELIELFKKYNMYPEVMTTPAACRTYNILVSEQRKIYAILHLEE